jgi:N,N'-diacetyllegionaminate synthase
MNSKVVIIAEAGVNHNGNIEIAKQLIDVAAEAKVDYIKFQTFIAEQVVTTTAKKAQYQIVNTGKSEETQLEMIKKLELSFDDFISLEKYAREKNIKFLSTAFDMESVDFLKKMELGLWKIPSGEITNYPYIRKIGHYKEKMLISTGMCDMSEIKVALDTLLDFGVERKNIVLLQCNTAYPTPLKDVNLNAMVEIGKEFKVDIGYSDHTLNNEVAFAAVALGAKVIEKHFTLDRSMEGPDHMASLEPKELKELVSGIRNIEKALGNGIKKPSVSESINIAVARRSIHLAIDLKAGDQITELHLEAKRPGTGLSPMLWNKIIGKRAAHDLQKGIMLTEIDFI